MCRLMILFWLAICLLSHPSGARAQGAPDLGKAIAIYGPVGSRTLMNEILPALNKTLSPRERALMAEIEWRFPIEANALNARAFIDPASGAKVIEISAGHVLLLDLTIAAGLVAQEFGKDDLVADYFLEVVGTVRGNVYARARGAPAKPIPSFEQFASIPADASGRYMGSAAYQANRRSNLTSALAVVVSHELAHHLLGHTVTPQQSTAHSRRREADADAYAAKVADQAGFSAASVAPLMGLFASMEGDAASLILLIIPRPCVAKFSSRRQPRRRL